LVAYGTDGQYGTNTNHAPWKTPTGKPWTTTETIDGTNTPFGTYARDDAGAYPSVSEASWSIMRNATYNAKTRWVSYDGRQGAASDDETFFLPAAGWLVGNNTVGSNNGGSGAMDGISNGVPTTAGYWTSSATTGNTSPNYYDDYVLCLTFNSTVMSPSKDLWRSWALPVRCVPVQP
jgi:hypothetical protein